MEDMTVVRWCRNALCRNVVLSKVIWGVVLILLTAGVAAAQDKRVALVVGNAQYHNGGAAAGVAANAATMADALKRAGFAVTVADNLDHRGMVAAISRFQDALSAGDLGFFYYSGVALSLSAKSFLVPVDAKLASEYDVIFDTIELDYVLKEIQRGGRKAVAVFDPVPSHPLTETLAAAMGDAGRSVKPVLTAPSAFDNLFVVYSHRPGTPPAALSGNGPSVFTAALAQEMVKPGVGLLDALGEVARTVVGKTRGGQHPWLQDQLGTGLVLVPGTAKPGPAVAALPAPAKPEPKPEDKPAVVPTPMPALTPTVAEIEVDPLDETRVVSRDTKLRAAPDNKAAVVGGLRHDAEVKITGRPKKNSGWLRVEHEGKTGFAYAANLAKPEDKAKAETPLASAPPTQPQGNPLAASGPAPGIYAVLRESNMFARPTLGARSVRDLEQGQLVTLVESVPDSNWALVRDRFGNEGYVSTGALSGRVGDVPGTSASAAGGASGPGTSGRPVSLTPNASPAPVVARGDIDPLAGSLAGTTGSTEIAALPNEPAGRSAGSREPAAAGLAAPYREAVEAGRKAASRATSAANAGRAAENRARQVQASARQVAQQGRGGSGGASVYKFPNGDVYEGAWGRGGGGFGLTGTVSKDGVGIYRFANGQVYEGEWKGDQMSGVGVMTFTSGDRYEGTFSNGVPNGPGVYHFANGDSYAGEIKAGRVDGHGEMVFTNGDRYDGVVVDRLPNGNGELVMRGGARHVGVFRGGIQDGPGAAIMDGGALRPGIWRGATLLSE
ncbi:caspase family protein [Azospirillum canadense]|uniref:caspase family protein n=1 Tax=Azospirillum canadense TaxID=403962 RepID=UPI00222701F5|nr:caspase family protein [Azospirillum canadense]MCW2237516.1 hypothetical protein [Azospirillum canadense]